MKSNRDDPTVRDMLSGLRAKFNTLFDVGRGYAISNRHKPDQALGKTLLASLNPLKAKQPAAEPVACTFTVQPRGTVSFVVLEPLSKEKMWVKRLDLEVPAESLDAMNDLCDGQALATWASKPASAALVTSSGCAQPLTR